MNTHLPADLEQFVQAKVRSGRFTSPEEAITAAVRLLGQQEEAEEARVLNGIRQGLEDMPVERGILEAEDRSRVSAGRISPL